MWRPNIFEFINRFTSGKIIEDSKEAFNGLSLMLSDLFGSGQDQQSQGQEEVSPVAAYNRSGGKGEQRAGSKGRALHDDNTHVVEMGDGNYKVVGYRDGKGNPIDREQYNKILSEAMERAGPIKDSYRGSAEKGAAVQAMPTPGEAKSGAREVS